MIVHELLLQKTSSDYVKIVAITQLSSVIKDKRIQQEAAKSMVSFSSDKKRAAGALTNLIRAVSARVMLQRNFSVDKGLVNGSMGYVCGFETLPTGEIGSVLVRFDG